MSHPDATSPEVADACRRAGLPYTLNVRGEGMDAAVAGHAPMSARGEQLTRSLADLERVLLDMGSLYGPALAAPADLALARLRSSWDGYQHEVWEGARYRDQLERDVARAQHDAYERAGERDRARDLAAHLEAELDGLDVAAIRRTVLREAQDLVGRAIVPLGDPPGQPTSNYNAGLVWARDAAARALDEALDDDAAARLTAVDVPLLGPVVVDPSLPEDVLELRGATTTRIRIGDVPPAGGGLADPIAEDPTASAGGECSQGCPK